MRISPLAFVIAASTLGFMSPLGAAPPTAPAVIAQPPKLAGIAVFDAAAVALASNAAQSAAIQRQAVYKASYDQAAAISANTVAQIKIIQDQIKDEMAKSKPNRELIQALNIKLQNTAAQAKAMIQQTMIPVRMSEAYGMEQIMQKLSAALQTVMLRKKITIVHAPSSLVIWDLRYDINKEVLAELNTILPAIAVTPPVGWRPAQAQ